jgi:hypothetical protein
MSGSTQFWQYAEEAMLSARHSKTDNEKQAQLDLARSWTEAALRSESAVIVPDYKERFHAQ